MSLVVPGHPPVLVPSRIEERFRLTKGSCYTNTEEGIIDDDAQVLPLTRGQSLFEAIKLCSPRFDIRAVDFVAHIRIIRKLLDVCRSRGDRKRPRCDIGGWQFLIYDANSRQRGQVVTKEKTTTPTIVFTRAGPIMDHEDSQRLEQKAKTSYVTQYRQKVTTREAGSPSGARKRLSLITKVDLGDVQILVQTDVHAVERQQSSTKDDRVTPQGGTLDEKSRSGEFFEHEDSKDPMSNLRSIGGGSKSDETTATGAESSHIKSGTILGADDTIVELLTCNSWYTHEIQWRTNYWHNAFAGSGRVIIGRHNRGLFNANRSNKPLHLTASEVESRAAKEGSLSLEFFANTLQEIAKAARTLLPVCPFSEVDGDQRQVAVVDFPCSLQDGALVRRIRLRPYDG